MSEPAFPESDTGLRPLPDHPAGGAPYPNGALMLGRLRAENRALHFHLGGYFQLLFDGMDHPDALPLRSLHRRLASFSEAELLEAGQILGQMSMEESAERQCELIARAQILFQEESANICAVALSDFIRKSPDETKNPNCAAPRLALIKGIGSSRSHVS